ncbi:tetratricopeptide repeat protein, partial [Methylacidimicrobium cyclopophantes]|uniref:tetratricopeptide repeat protein n=1 Tax=Methylacidimicrobium cyclopophantes TaxID=1041766 RepID=UPI0035B52395
MGRRALAANHLGVLYRSGQGVPQDDRKAARWFRRAASAGERFGQLNLGDLYALGRGVGRDLRAAARWW